MTIHTSLANAKTLLEQLSASSEQAELVAQLTIEINNIESQIAELTTPATKQTNAAVAALDKASGCYRLETDPAFYCPHCYEREKRLHATQRINSKLRVCPSCRSSIKAV